MKIWNNVYAKHIFCAVLAVVFILTFSNVCLNIFTRHGQLLILPDFRGKTLDSVRIIAKQNDFRIEITDSVYRIDFPKGTVLMQNPEAESQVKKNRKIFLTINSLTQKKEVLPYVIDLSLRQAKTALNAKGFRVGRLIYDPANRYTNHVLQQMYKGANIDAGIRLPVGEYIDLKLGMDTTSNLVSSVPEVVGLQRATAEDLIVENSLNCQYVFDPGMKNIADSLNTIVYRQEPTTGAKLRYGAGVKIWLKMVKTKSK